MTDKKKKTAPFLRQDLFKVPSSPDEKPYLIGGKCKRCGRYFFPRKTVCSSCLEEGTMQDVPLSRRGKIHESCCSFVAPVGYKAPHIAAWIDLPEKIRIFAILEGVDVSLLRPEDAPLNPGTEVELVIGKIREDERGEDVIAYKFKPV